MQSEQPVRLHLGCGEKYLEGYTNIDYPQSEQSVIKSHADVYADLRTLTYPDGTVDEIRSHHVFEHFSRAEALKLLARWRTWLKPNGTLIIETPDFTTSATMFLHSSNMRRRAQLSRHIYGSEEASWATHKDYWDRKKFAFTLRKFGFRNIKISNYWNGLARHAEKIPRVGAMLTRLPEILYVAPLNVIGHMLPESFYKKYGSNKMPNVLARATKDASVHIDDEKIAHELLGMYRAGKEGDELLEVWMKEYRNF